MNAAVNAAGDSAVNAAGQSPRRHHRGFWVVTVVFVLVMAYATVPTPLYPLYQEADGFASSTTTVVFAAFAVGVMVSLYLAGHISDWVGRRRVLVAACLLSAVAAALFLASPALPVLLVARLVDGFAVGILTATATAHLGELRAVARPDENAVIASAVAGAANIGGLAIGPLIGGVFAEFLPAPLQLPHLVFLVVLLGCAVVLRLVPETVTPPEVRPRWRPQRVSPPRGAEREFRVAALAGFSEFAVFGLFTALAPAYLASTFGITDHLVAGSTTFAVFGSAALCQALLVSLAVRTQLAVAWTACAVGLAAIGAGAVLGILVLFFAGAIAAGAGVGVLFRSALQTTVAVAAPAHRGAAIALYFLIAYTGLAVPVLVVGLALLVVPADVVLVAFLAVAAVATVGSALRLRAMNASRP